MSRLIRDLLDLAGIEGGRAITCGQPLTVECSAPGGSTVTPSATGSDVCSSCSVSCPPGFFPVGRTTSGSCGATDQAKNRASCTESITVFDTTAPSVTAALTVTTSGRKHDGDDDGRKNLFPVRCAATDTYDPAPSVQAFVPLGDISACRIVLHKDRDGDDCEEQGENGPCHKRESIRVHRDDGMCRISLLDGVVVRIQGGCARLGCQAHDASGHESRAEASPPPPPPRD